MNPPSERPEIIVVPHRPHRPAKGLALPIAGHPGRDPRPGPARREPRLAGPVGRAAEPRRLAVRPPRDARQGRADRRRQGRDAADRGTQAGRRGGEAAGAKPEERTPGTRSSARPRRSRPSARRPSGSRRRRPRTSPRPRRRRRDDRRSTRTGPRSSPRCNAAQAEAFRKMQARMDEHRANVRSDGAPPGRGPAAIRRRNSPATAPPRLRRTAARLRQFRRPAARHGPDARPPARPAADPRRFGRGSPRRREAHLADAGDYHGTKLSQPPREVRPCPPTR